MEAFLKEVRTRIDISLDYSPKVYAGQITLFRATDIGPDLKTWADIDDPSYGWSRFSDREVKIVDVPGSHATICVPPYVETLGPRLASCLEEAVCAIAFKAQR
jgi:thioesterase domain-containing protein